MKRKLQLADSLRYALSDSTITAYDNIRYEAQQLHDTVTQIRCLRLIGEVHYTQLEFDKALEFFTQARHLCDKVDAPLQKSNVLGKLGRLYCKFGNTESGQDYIRQAHTIKKQLVLEDKCAPSELIGSYLNMTEIARQQVNDTLSLQYLDTCIAISNASDKPSPLIGNVYRIKASVLIATGKHREAMKILQPLVLYYDSISTANHTNVTYKYMHVLVLTSTAKAYRIDKKLDKSVTNYKKALNIININQIQLDYQPYILTDLAHTYQEQNKYKKAFATLLKAKQISSTYFRTNSARNKGVLKVRDSYKEQLDAQEKELLAKNLELVSSEQVILRFQIILLVILLCIVAAVLLLRNKIQRNNHQIERKLTQKQTQEKERKSQEKLELKNKELTSYALQLMERDDLLDQFVHYFNDSPIPTKAKSLIISRKQLQLNTWDEFEKRFVSINQGFYDRLRDKSPDLTVNDLKYCALFKLHLKGKQISKLLGVTEKSVHMASYRIRKKIKIETDSNLMDFLSKI